MLRTQTLPIVCVIALALLIGACGDGGEQADDMTDTTETAMMPTPGSVTVAGTLIDSKCYGMNHDNLGNDHGMPDGSTVAGCGAACAKMGLPVAVLEGGTKDAKVYVLVAPSAPLADHVSKEVRVSGMPVYDSGMIPGKIEVKDAQGAWVDVTPGAMM